MSRWRLIVVACLLALPFLTLAGAGSYYLWSVGLGFYVWWPMTGCLALGYALGWYWQRQRRLLHAIEFTAPLHWTERDRQAWTLVEARAHDAVKVDPNRFTDLQFFVNVAKEMAEELAGFYHPGAKDPVSALTITEILAVIELVASDLADCSEWR